MELYSAIVVNFNVVVLLISFGVVLHKIFEFKFLWIMLLLHILVAVSVVTLLEGFDSPNVAFYASPFLYVSTALWDSRTFIIDKFNYFSWLIHKPFYLIFPISVALVASGILPLDIDIKIFLLLAEAALGVVVSEVCYPVANRTRTISSRSPRRASIRNISAMSSALVSPVNAARVHMNNIRV